MRLYMISLVGLFLVNAFANAQGLEACQQEVATRYRQVLPVTIAAHEHQIEIKLETSFWSGNYGLTILIDNQVYTSFGEYARGFAFPVVFNSNRSVSSGYGKIQAGMEAYVHSAALQNAQITLDMSHLRAGVGSFGRCWIDGDSIEDVISLAKAPAPSPTPEPVPPAEPVTAPKPSLAGHDQSEILPEGQAPRGKTLKPDGDR